MFVFSKPASATKADIPKELGNQIRDHGFHKETNEGGVTYRKGSFTLGRDTSLFGGFSEVRLAQERGAWVLRLKLNRSVWLVFVIFPVALLAFRPLHSIGIGDVSEAFAAPAAIVIAALLWARVRLARWWGRL